MTGTTKRTTGATNPGRARPPDRLLRFGRTTRAAHWTTAALGLTLIATGATMYFGPLSIRVGHRELVRNVHVVAGLLLLVPLLIGVALPRAGAALRADVGALNRFDDDDRRALRLDRRTSARPAKFNAGQKLNAAFLAGAAIVLLGTGCIMKWSSRFAVDIRTGATFVHDWFAIGVTIAITGHILMALLHPEALRGMVRGWVSSQWARRTHPRWYERMTGLPADRFARTAQPAPPGTAPAVADPDR